MNWVFISLILISVGQTAVCGFGFTMLISYIGRLIFLLRRIGSVVPYKAVSYTHLTLPTKRIV